MGILERVLGPPSLPEATLHELCALVREQNLLLRELVRLNGGNLQAIPRTLGPSRSRRPYGSEDVLVSGRTAQLEREWEAQNRDIAPHRYGPASTPTSKADGSEPASGEMSLRVPLTPNDPS